jgi:hypothetical protein
MLEMHWLDPHHLPNGTLIGGLELANQLYWNLSIVQTESEWYVYGGEKVILRTDSRDAVDAFLYGMGLAYGILPEYIFKQLREYVRELVE